MAPIVKQQAQSWSDRPKCAIIYANKTHESGITLALFSNLKESGREPSPSRIFPKVQTWQNEARKLLGGMVQLLCWLDPVARASKDAGWLPGNSLVFSCSVV